MQIKRMKALMCRTGRGSAGLVGEMTGVRRTIPAGKSKAKAMEEKESTEAREDWEAKEHSRTPGRQRILVRRIRRRSTDRM